MSSDAEAAHEEASSRGGDIVDTDVLVLGASFAGLEVALQLRRRNARLRITVVDRQSEHGYLPLVHERLCGRTPVDASVLPTGRCLAALSDTRFVQGEVVGLDPDTKIATLASGIRLRGRFVVVALGSVLAPPATIPGHERMLVHKLADEFTHARERLEIELRERKRVVVIGGGLSGVELAGELADLRRTRPEGWQAPQVTLVTRGARLLPVLAPGVAATTLAALRRQDVEVHLSTRLAAVKPGAVVVDGDGGERELPADLVFWAGGVRPAPILSALGLPMTHDGWLEVGPTMQCFADVARTQPDVFACGDAVKVVGGTGRWPTMVRAIECIWQAAVVATNIARLAREPADYPHGIPPLRPHRLRARFFYGVSAGDRSYVVYGRWRVHVPGLTPWFRRWLMRQYFARYRPARALAATADEPRPVPPPT